MNNLQALLDTIESVDFDVRYMILSGFSTVLSSLDSDEHVQNLIRVLKNNPDNQTSVLRRIEFLMADYENGFQHTHDIAITAYLYVLQVIESYGILEQIVYTIANQLEFWWARKLSQKIILEHLDKITTTKVVILQLQSVADVKSSSYNSNSDTKLINQLIPA